MLHAGEFSSTGRVNFVKFPVRQFRLTWRIFLQNCRYCSVRNVSWFVSIFLWTFRHKGKLTLFRSKSLFHGVPVNKMSRHWRHTVSQFRRSSPSNCWKTIRRTSTPSVFDWLMVETLICDYFVGWKIESSHWVEHWKTRPLIPFERLAETRN